MFEEEDERAEVEKQYPNVVHMVWEDHLSQLSTQASSGIHFSTPVDDGSIHHNLSFDGVASQHDLGRKLKYSKGDVKAMLQELTDATEVAQVIVNNLIGGNPLHLNTSEDIAEIENLESKIKAKVYRLKDALKKRQFRKHPSLLEVTFLTAEEYLEHSYHFNNMEEERTVSKHTAVPVVESDVANKKLPTWKPLNEIANRKYQRERTSVDFDAFREMSKKQKVDVGQMAGYFLQREYYNSNRYVSLLISRLVILMNLPFFRKLAQVGTQLLNQKFEVEPRATMDLESGFHIQVRYKFSKIKWINLGFILFKHVKIPSFHLLSAHRIKICPELFKYPSEAHDEPVKGVFANLGEMMVLHFLRLLQFDGSFLETVKENCCIKAFGGLDCAGDQKEYQQRSQLNMETSHVENGSYCMTSIHVDPCPSDAVQGEVMSSGDNMVTSTEMGGETLDHAEGAVPDDEDLGVPASIFPKIKKPLGYKQLGRMVYSENLKGSVRASRPWFMIFMRENTDTLRELVKEIIEPQMLQLVTFEHSVDIDATETFLTTLPGSNHLQEKSINTFNESQKVK